MSRYTEYRAKKRDDPAWRERQREHCRRSYRKHRAKHLQWAKEKAEKYKRETPLVEQRLKARMKKARRRAAKAKVESTLTRDEWLSICREFRDRCAYCRKKRPLEQDHIIPITRGGAHARDNVVPACKSCNSAKGAGPVLVPVQQSLPLEHQYSPK